MSEENNSAALLENEWYLVRDSGELPETAFHASLHYLTSHSDGPHLQLDAAQRRSLFYAAAQRFEEIILRDLDFIARKSPAVRGVGRAIINCQRFFIFCRRQKEESFFASSVCEKLRPALADFLYAAEKEQRVVVNCSEEEIRNFAARLGATLPANVAKVFIFSR